MHLATVASSLDLLITLEIAGIAIAAIIPKITITASNSINVKPFCSLSFNLNFLNIFTSPSGSMNLVIFLYEYTINVI